MIRGLGGKPTQAGRNLLSAMMVKEGTLVPANNNYIGKIYNPLDSTLPEPGSTFFNHITPTIGVQTYPNLTEGLKANISTLSEKQYAPLAQGIKTGNASEFFSQAGYKALETWANGSGPATNYPNQLQSEYNVLSTPGNKLSVPTMVNNIPGEIAMNGQPSISPKGNVHVGSTITNLGGGITGFFGRLLKSIEANALKWIIIIAIIVLIIGLIIKQFGIHVVPVPV